MKIKRITKIKTNEDVYDLEVPFFHNFIINLGTVVHNCRYAMERYWNRRGH